MMKPTLFAVLGAFALMGFMGGCEGKAPVVHMCKTYTDAAACAADDACQWMGEANPGEEGAVAKCKAKPKV